MTDSQGGSSSEFEASLDLMEASLDRSEALLDAADLSLAEITPDPEETSAAKFMAAVRLYVARVIVATPDKEMKAFFRNWAPGVGHSLLSGVVIMEGAIGHRLQLQYDDKGRVDLPKSAFHLNRDTDLQRLADLHGANGEAALLICAVGNNFAISPGPQLAQLKSITKVPDGSWKLVMDILSNPHRTGTDGFGGYLEESVVVKIDQGVDLSRSSSPLHHNECYVSVPRPSEQKRPSTGGESSTNPEAAAA